MNKIFYGMYAPHMKELVELKRSLGFKYTGGEFVLSILDKFTMERNETTAGIKSGRFMELVYASAKLLP